MFTVYHLDGTDDYPVVAIVPTLQDVFSNVATMLISADGDWFAPPRGVPGLDYYAFEVCDDDGGSVCRIRVQC